MKNILFAFTFLVALTSVKAQQIFLFKIKFLPNRLYESTVNSNTDMQMNFSGDSVAMAQIKAKEIKLPMILSSESNITYNVKTGALKTGKLFPIALFFKDNTEKQNLNGIEKSGVPNPLVGQTIFAQYSLDGKISIDSISGKTVDNQIKEALSSMIDNAMNQMHFPDAPMKIGDIFTQEVPFNLPLTGFNMQANLKIIYKLISVENNMAFFDMDESMRIDLTTEKNSTTVTVNGAGSGNGKLIYDINNNYAPYRTAGLKMNYQMQMGKLTMTCTAQIIATTETKISTLTN